jgi:hypothetical protein
MRGTAAPIVVMIAPKVSPWQPTNIIKTGTEPPPSTAWVHNAAYVNARPQ